MCSSKRINKFRLTTTVQLWRRGPKRIHYLFATFEAWLKGYISNLYRFKFGHTCSVNWPRKGPRLADILVQGSPGFEPALVRTPTRRNGPSGRALTTRPHCADYQTLRHLTFHTSLALVLLSSWSLVVINREVAQLRESMETYQM